MAHSIKTHSGNDSDTDFLFDKPYIKEADVHGYVDGVEAAITFVDPTTVRFTIAPATGTDNVQIKRLTDTIDARFTFPNPTYITSSRLDGNSTQQLYLNQEQADITDLQIDATDSATQAADSATQAAASAATCTTIENDMQGRWYLPRGVELDVDDNGAASTVGDQYFNTALGVNRVFNGSTWQDAGNGSSDASTIVVADSAGWFSTSPIDAETAFAELGAGAGTPPEVMRVAYEDAVSNGTTLIFDAMPSTMIRMDILLQNVEIQDASMAGIDMTTDNHGVVNGRLNRLNTTTISTNAAGAGSAIDLTTPTVTQAAGTVSGTITITKPSPGDSGFLYQADLIHASDIWTATGEVGHVSGGITQFIIQASTGAAFGINAAGSPYARARATYYYY